MIRFAKQTTARKAKTKDVPIISIILASIIVVMLLAQLFKFEELSYIITAFALPISSDFSSIIAGILVSLELFSLPFILSMTLSPLMRIMSMIFGWLVVTFWLFVSLWLNLNQVTNANAGIFGATIELPIGWWMLGFSILLGVLTARVSWGMWPITVIYNKN